jgi:hypothetical protein
MPNPSVSGTTSPVSAIVAQFRQLHEELRLEIQRCNAQTLNWTPCPGANTAATIVSHTLGSEAETVCAVAGLTHQRDRDAEFQKGDQSRPALIGQVDDADALLDELAPKMTEARAGDLMALPTLPADDMRSGLTWLIGNLGHAREHMGQLRLTIQLYEAGPRQT